MTANAVTTIDHTLTVFESFIAGSFLRDQGPGPTLVLAEEHVALEGRDGDLGAPHRVLGDVGHGILGQGGERNRFGLGTGFQCDPGQPRLAVVGAEPQLLPVEVEAGGEHARATDQALETLGRIARQVESVVRASGDNVGIRGMHRQAADLGAQPLRGGTLPLQAVVQREIDAGLAHAAVGRVVEHGHRVGLVAGRQQVEVRFARESERLPGLAAVAALDQAEGIGHAGTRCRVPAAVQRVSRGGIAHVVVRRSGRLGPTALLKHCEPVVARDDDACAIGAEGQAVDMGQGECLAGMGRRRGGGTHHHGGQPGAQEMVYCVHLENGIQVGSGGVGTDAASVRRWKNLFTGITAPIADSSKWGGITGGCHPDEWQRLARALVGEVGASGNRLPGSQTSTAAAR